jgi:4-hydroxymandelate oxidase
MVNTTELNLSLDLFGEKHFAPILVGPVSKQKRFHAEGELEMVRGAAAAKTAMVIAADSSFPLDQIMPLAKAGAWFQVNPETDAAKARQAVAAGCKVICMTGTNWKVLAALAKAIDVPVVAKGVITPAEAEAAISAGAEGIIVSSYNTTSKLEAIEALPTIADAVKGRVPILVDGGFRRGSDLLKGLALGASAILVARAPACGLAAYGAPGVQRALEILQTDLGRDMAMCGKVNLAAIGRDTVKIHRF